MTRAERIAALALALALIAVLLSALALAVAVRKRSVWAEKYVELQNQTCIQTGQWIDVQ